MFPDYEELVVAHYHQKRLGSDSRLWMIDPTPAGLRDQCIVVLNERDFVKDLKVLREFFELKSGEQISDQVIKRFDRDKFKPLSNFLKNPKIKTYRKNIELLAWLIDFKPRPFEIGRKYKPIDSVMPEPEKKQPESNDEQGQIKISKEPDNNKEGKNDDVLPQPDYGKPDSKFKIFAVLASIIILVGTGTVMYQLRNNRPSGIYLTGQEKCMYWAGDHYEPISCHPRRDTAVIALDSVRLHYFKKITTPDTITLNAIGKVWYSKKSNEFEYYTSDGDHPVDNRLRLRPITAYIIKKHILGLE